MLFAFFFGSIVFADQKGMVAKLVRETISTQIFAFQKNDVVKAYSFAAPNIKAQYPDPAIFGSMVKNGYPIIWNPKKFKFATFKNRGDRSIQRVLFQSFEGNLKTYDYIMEKVGEKWKIAGVISINVDGEI